VGSVETGEIYPGNAIRALFRRKRKVVEEEAAAAASIGVVKVKKGSSNLITTDSKTHFPHFSFPFPTFSLFRHFFFFGNNDTFFDRQLNRQSNFVLVVVDIYF